MDLKFQVPEIPLPHASALYSIDQNYIGIIADVITLYLEREPSQVRYLVKGGEDLRNVDTLVIEKYHKDPFIVIRRNQNRMYEVQGLPDRVDEADFRAKLPSLYERAVTHTPSFF